MSKISPNPGSLSAIMRSYKSAVSNEIHDKTKRIFHWQYRFYDQIIKNYYSLNKIREYIIDNPETWKRDRNNLENLWI